MWIAIIALVAILGFSSAHLSEQQQARLQAIAHQRRTASDQAQITNLFISRGHTP
jgi:hypothetical protein